MLRAQIKAEPTHSKLRGSGASDESRPGSLTRRPSGIADP
jgi:hypothetical protein